LAANPWCLAGGAVVDVALDVANGGRERFEGRLELALEAEADGKQPARVWRRASDVRLDAGQALTLAQSFEPDPPRLWRPDDPFLYRLTATVQTREGQAVRTVPCRIGLRSAAASQGRWLANGEWVRLAGIAATVRGATLLCTQPGQAIPLSMKAAAGKEPPLDELLAFCDEEGILAVLDAPACAPDTPGWAETIAALAAEALRHPCVCGWLVRGEGRGTRGEGGGAREESEDPESEIRNPKSEISTLARLRELTPRLPIGRPLPCTAAEAKDFDFLLSRFATRPGREDDDAYGRRLDDLVRDAGGKAVIAIDRVAETDDVGRTDGSLAHRLREVERRSQVAALAFELDADETLLAAAEKRLSPFRLNPPSHEARLDRETFVLKTRFEAHLASPVAQRLPCYSLAGCRIAWTASRGDALVAAGAVPLTNAQPRAIEGGCQPGRGEVEWRIVGGASAPREEAIEFAAELHIPSGRVLARHASRMSLRTKDGRAEVSVEPLDKREVP
ncbi:MAG: hypothetical protein FJ291_27925, partial [Planctomycetes bacterium]|nr:hypothetical protein [Planctomycetota bacterium]